MILDSSAAVSVILREDGYERLARAMRQAPEVGDRRADPVRDRARDRDSLRRARPRELVLEFLETNEVVVTPFDGRHWELAAEAFLRYGKGRHPARLNYGDCMTYATARLAGEPLLFVGEDFRRTDLTPALAG